MTTDIDQIALDTTHHIEDALLRPYHSTAQRRAALQVIIANALRTSHLAAPYTLAEPVTGGWIGWNGGAVPVPDGTLVDVRMRDGNEYAGQQAFRDRKVSYAEPSRATPAYWIHDNIGNDITAYRLHKEPTK